MDSVLGQQEWEKLEGHLAQCPECKSEFEVEKLARNIVKFQCRRMRAPGHVLDRINEQLSVDQPPLVRKPSWKDRLSSPYLLTGAGLGVVAFAAIFFMNTTASSRDVIEQSFANYKAVARGDLKPQLVSDNTENVQKFFDGKTQFSVVVPSMKGCRLVGGVVDEVSGEKLAHVLYNHDDSDVVYLYETCWQTVQDGKDFHLSQNVQDEIRRTGWYAASDPEGHSMVMWTKGNTLCSAVAKMDKETLLACLNAGL